MGRVKGRHLKVAAVNLAQRGGDALEAGFEASKKLLREMGVMRASKKERNKLAGHLSRKIKAARRDDA